MIDFSQAKQIQREYDKDFDIAYTDSVAYLKETDWQVIAKYERKRAIPDEVQAKRKAALDVVTAEPATET
ncbi:hypothetical protein K0P33_12085 [Pseudomonas sp. ArH3a]|uniref:hypothetical protein n=1 Tax=Pseudomonas sp. ArH3a TaxID=2862945 RepID=UPI001F55B15C|nr:hypothetical protein [Pseudomonas sp. ArH3a]UNM22142.1 hypothetical protein K0P33_12085 [Pseudomonas sp. ArH3a]